jgi:hypothetical protein
MCIDIAHIYVYREREREGERGRERERERGALDSVFTDIHRYKVFCGT